MTGLRNSKHVSDGVLESSLPSQVAPLPQMVLYVNIDMIDALDDIVARRFSPLVSESSSNSSVDDACIRRKRIQRMYSRFDEV